MSQPEHVWIRETKSMLDFVNAQLAKAEEAKMLLNQAQVPPTLPPQFVNDIDFTALQVDKVIASFTNMKGKLEKRIQKLELMQKGPAQAALQGLKSGVPDLELKNIGQYYGSDTLYQSQWGRYTEGVKYVMENGYAWFVNDALIAIHMKPSLKGQPFLVVWLKLKEGPNAYMVIDDGNGHIVYTQDYVASDAKVSLKLYYENGVMMLPGER